MHPDDLFTRDQHLSSLSLELYLLDDLSPDLRRTALEHVNGCSTCSARLNALREHDDAFLSLITIPSQLSITPQAPPSPVAPSPDRSSPPPRPPQPTSSTTSRPLWTRPAFGLGVLLCVAALGGVVALLISSDTTREAPSLFFDVQGGSSVNTLHSLSAAEPPKPTDIFRIQVTTKDPGYLLVVGVDGADKVRRYYPATRDRAEAFKGKGASETLKPSLEARDLMKTERVLALYCNAPFDLNDVAKGIAKASRSTAQSKALSWSRDGCNVYQLNLKK